MSKQLEFKWEEQVPLPVVKETVSRDIARPVPPSTADETRRLQRALSEGSGIRIRLRITNNTSTIMSLQCNAERTTARLGLHHMFLEATAEVQAALVTWIRYPKQRPSSRVIDEFIAAHENKIQRKKPRRATLSTKGQCHDLEGMFLDLNHRHFAGTVIAPVTWGRMPSLRKRHSIRFGSFSPTENLIRIHPLLDQPFVPQYFVRYILFHEMLHAHLGIEEGSTGRRMIHPPQFKRMEKAYPDYDRAIAWLENPAHLRRLLHHRHRP
jgi:hypothetical protein